jgi:hypothetical protein
MPSVKKSTQQKIERLIEQGADERSRADLVTFLDKKEKLL